MKKIILVNILILLAIFAVSELFVWNKFFRNNQSFIPNYSYRDGGKLSNLERISTGTQYKKSPILLLGCSYTYGHGIPKNENFASQLSGRTKRPVYNWAYPGDGPIHNIFKLREPANLQYLTNGKPKYIIYTYMFDQTLRVTYLQNSLMYYTRLLYYARKAGLMPPQKFIPFIDRFYTVQFLRDKSWNDYLFNHQQFDDINTFFDYLKFLFITMKQDSDKIFPDSEFIILLYDENIDDIYELHQNFYKKLFKSDRWKELEEYGIKTVSVKELIGFELSDKYMLPREQDYGSHPHPSAKAWKVIVPKLAERFRL